MIIFRSSAVRGYVCQFFRHSVAIGFEACEEVAAPAAMVFSDMIKIRLAESTMK